MVVGRVELQETVEKLFEIIFGVQLFLQNHLQHGAAEVQIRVVGIFLHRHTLTAEPPEALDGPQALDVGLGVGGGEGGGSGGGAGGGGVAEVGVVAPPWTSAGEERGEAWPCAAVAAP